MKKYLIIAASLFSLASCTKDISSYNEQTKAAADVPGYTLFSNGLRHLTYGLTTPNVNRNVLRMTVQHWTTTSYAGEPRYDFDTRNITGLWWDRMNRDVLSNLNAAKANIAKDGLMTEVVKKNQTAITDIVQVYTWMTLVNSFGDIPYTEALNSDNLFPKYDDAKTVYEDLFKRLDDDITALDPTAAGMPATADLLYGGSVAGWVKFANALKVKMAMTYADVDGSKAKTAFEAAENKSFASASDNAVFKFLTTTPYTNPLWEDLVQSNRQDFIACKTFMDVLNNLHDPRKSQFFKASKAGEWIGGIAGTVPQDFESFASASEKLKTKDLPALVIDYVEMEFYRAEAAERGYTVSGTAEQHYNNAITASIIYWGGSTADAAAYLAQPEVAYATAQGDWKQKIGTQKWIALYNRGVEGWTEIRRLDYPTLPAPTAALSGFPNRYKYPAIEQQLNPANYKAAAAAIGGDKVETKLFWDKF